jgi:amphi-Trp domain-containing protein
MDKKKAKQLAKDQARKAKAEARAAKEAQQAQEREQRRKAEAILTREQIADQLRALASQVEAGTVLLGDKEVELPPSADFELGYKPKRKGGHQIEVEIEWGSPASAPLLPTE